MFCSFYKWQVSRFLDQAQDVSPGVSRHISKCKSCADFYHSALLVGKQLAEEKDEVIKPLSESFTATILSAATETRQRHLHPVKKRFLLPAAVAATLAIVTLFSFVWLANPPQPSLFPESQLFSLASLEKREQAVQKFMGQIESPIQREARQLKKSFQSATSFLISCLDLKISTSQTL